jgi:hypothetical protein
VRVVSLLGLATALAVEGCVVTTHEGPGDPPRVLAAPPPPTLGGPPPNGASDVPGESATDGDDSSAADETIAASHLLVQYQGAMRAAPHITRSKEEALKRAEEALAKLRAGADFVEVVAQYSDEPGAAERGGSLGHFTRDRMIKPFADAAFALKRGQLSDVVETPFGYHVIKRTD